MSVQPENRVRLDNVRAAFTKNLFTAGDFQGNGVMKFSIVLLFPASHPAHDMVKKAAQNASKAKWGAKAVDNYRTVNAQDRGVIHDGDVKSQFAGYEGNLYINASNEEKPDVYDRGGAPLDGTEGRIYSGCYVDAFIDVWIQDNKYGKRINASLVAVRFREDGERLASGGAKASADDFEPITDLDVDDNGSVNPFD